MAHCVAKVVAEEEIKKGNLEMNYTHKIQNEEDTWVPSLENWDGRLKIFYAVIYW